jgi:hypothetical protein
MAAAIGIRIHSIGDKVHAGDKCTECVHEALVHMKATITDVDCDAGIWMYASIDICRDNQQFNSCTGRCGAQIKRTKVYPDNVGAIRADPYLHQRDSDVFSKQS